MTEINAPFRADLRTASLFLLTMVCAAQQIPAPQVVNLMASDGTVLKGTYFASAKPGPGVLLLSQCNQQRKLWDPLGEHLAAAGINALTVDYRGYGESGGTPDARLTPQQRQKIQTEMWPGDIDTAFQYLLAHPGVTRSKVGAGGASCGVDNAIKLVRRHPEVKALVLLSGETDRDGRAFLQSSNLPVFAAAAEDDPFGPQVLLVQWLFSLSRNRSSRFARYDTGGHGAEMFAVHPELPRTIAEWFVSLLIDKPASVPRTNGSRLETTALHTLEWIDQPGGAVELAKTWSSARASFPEVLINLLGYEHLQNQDSKGAVEILKLNVLAFPNSAGAYDSLADAYMADGQKELALENARKALAAVLHDTIDTEQRRIDIRDSAEQKVKQLTE